MSVARLIINADDLGYDPEVSRGIIEAMRRGVVSSTTLMVNTPSSEAAAQQARGLAVGLHLNLARWKALSAPTHEFDEHAARTLSWDFVAKELTAQLQRLETLMGAPATHVDVHKHLHRLPNVLTGVVLVAKGRKLAVRSPDSAVRAILRAAGVPTNDAMLGDAGRDAYWTWERFEGAVGALPEDGVVEVMCHPGYAPTTVQSGYSQQREVELATFTDERATALLAERGVRPVSWALVR